MDLLNLARDLIAADTVSHKGTLAAVSVLKPLYAQAGLSPRVQEVIRGNVHHLNLLGTLPGGDPRGLLLVTHLDTVDAGPHELWTETDGDPYRLTQKGDRWYGLGSADTKLDSLCKLFAVAEFKHQPLKRSVQLLGTFEEEVGGKGARYFVQSPEFKARFVACSEPSELKIIRAHKGYAVVKVRFNFPNCPVIPGPFEEVVFEGKSAHSSTPHLGVNALEKAIQGGIPDGWISMDGGTVSNKVPARCTVVRRAAASPVRAAQEALEASPAHDASNGARLADALFKAWSAAAKSLEPNVDPDFDPAHTVVNWGAAQIRGGEGQVVFDCRLLPGHSPQQLIAEFENQARRLSGRFGAELEIEVDRASPAMALNQPSELLSAAQAACRDVGLDDTPESKPTNTEAGIFAAAGVESLVFGPGRSIGNAHCANEHNLVSQLEKAIPFYRALIRRLCL